MPAIICNFCVELIGYLLEKNISNSNMRNWVFTFEIGSG